MNAPEWPSIVMGLIFAIIAGGINPLSAVIVAELFNVSESGISSVSGIRITMLTFTVLCPDRT